MIKSFNCTQEINSYRFVKPVNGAVVQCSSPADSIIGVCEPDWGKVAGAVDVSLPGEKAFLEAGSAFEAGDALTSDENGCAVRATADNNIGAIAINNATAAGDVVEVVVAIQRVLTSTPDSQEPMEPTEPTTPTEPTEPVES